MVNITIEGTDYDTDNMTDEQKELIEVLRINTTTSNLVGHMLQCVNAIGRVKVDELRASLSDGKKD
jgi:hypothetical protein|tara:strand:+ start:1753 stop:1950 length:198 start_codon:yes stop_codon:yes gene_type:complete